MSKRYDEDALRAICEQVDLLEYASSSLEFEKRGNDCYAAHCPAHVDNTPSLMITPSKNLFYCFSCKKRGNILNWLISYEHLHFNDAVEKLGQLTGTEIKNIKLCNALAYFKQMKRLAESNASKHIERQILDESSLDQFSDELPDEWIEEGILPEVMKKFNIRIDKKSNRIVYPVYDADLNLIGFKGRTRYPNYDKMRIRKYINYTKVETTDYFGGMKENGDRIAETGEVIIVEGIKSVMKLNGFGYDYALSAETSHLNKEQVKLLIKLGVKRVVIAFDNDVSFREACESANLLKRFTNVYVITDRHKLLGDPTEKLSPCDKGKEIWDRLYREKVRL